jgi:DNA polymerase-3 subunit gamma/tau
MAVLRDLAEITHWVSVIKITPEAAEDPTVGPDERTRGQMMAEQLPMRAMTRMWQLLLKALDEVATAPNTMMAAEMAIIRLTHMADLPSPDDLIRKLQSTPPPAAPTPGSTGGSAGGMTTARASQSVGSVASSGATTALAYQPEEALARFGTFTNVVNLIRTNRDMKLLVEVETTLQLASYAPGRIEFVPTETAPRDLAQRLGARLQQWTGNRWAVSVVNEGGAPTIASEKDAEENALREEASAHPMLQATLAAFPGAKIIDIRTPDQLIQEAAIEALPEVEDEWDPFEDG